MFNGDDFMFNNFFNEGPFTKMNNSEISLFSTIEALTDEEKEKYVVNKNTVRIGTKVYDRNDGEFYIIDDYDASTNMITLSKNYYVKRCSLYNNILWNKPTIAVQFKEYDSEFNGEEKDNTYDDSTMYIVKVSYPKRFGEPAHNKVYGPYKTPEEANSFITRVNKMNANALCRIVEINKE